jgi:chloramphenicol 3-O phosphotransferase
MIEDRTAQREDREIGLARWQYGRVHQGIAYDLEIDTASTAPAQCARLIQDTFGL